MPAYTDSWPHAVSVESDEVEYTLHKNNAAKISIWNPEKTFFYNNGYF